MCDESTGSVMRQLFVLFALCFSLISVDGQSKSSLSFKVPENFDISVFADKTHINNPISIAIDTKGRVYVAEIHRFQKGVEDSRRYNIWFLDEIKCNSLDDRTKLYEKWIGKGLFKKGHFSAHSDRIVTLYDKNNDGVADEMKEFSGKYNHPLDGNGSSILLGMDGEMYYANIPHIWKITDADGDGVSEKREEFITGFGFRSGVNGHDLHGLEWGVDGRLYFSNGDRGYGIKTKEGKTLFNSERGAIFRCEPDGSNLEIFTIGNRNPQDLAFDEYGNLFTVDNNRGRGDRSRVNYLVELGDYGWNSGHENKTTFFRAIQLHKRKGPKPLDSWIVEGDWKEQFDGQAAYCIPTMCYIDGGSAGLTFNPGESLGPELDNHFVYSAYQRGIYTFKFEPKGAGLKAVNVNNFWKGGHIIDTEFSPDGRLFVTDYVSTSNAQGNKGAIYILKDDKYLQKESVKSAKALLVKGFKKSTNDELLANLKHRDMRVRLFSQFELAKRNAKDVFHKAAKFEGNELTRLHGIWGLGQLARKDSKICSELVGYLKDSNWRVRAQTVKVIGEAKDNTYLKDVLASISDENQRVQFFALTAAGKLGKKETVSTVMKAVEANADKDIFLRHSAVASLIYTEAADDIFAYASHNSAAVRKVALLALARLNDKRIVNFVKDSDVKVAQEAIRCVDRVNVHSIVELAANNVKSLFSGKPQIAETDQDRVLMWLFRKGDEKAAETVSTIALNPEVSTRIRSIALNDLGRWSEELPVDPVVGQIRQINKDRADVKGLLKKTLLSLLKSKHDESFTSLVNTLSLEMGLGLDKDKITAQILNKKAPINTRLDYYNKMLAAKDKNPKLADITRILMKDESAKVRASAYVGLASMNKGELINKLKYNARNGTDLKATYDALTKLKGKEYEIVLVVASRLVVRNRHPRESILDYLTLAEKSKHKDVKAAVSKYKSSFAADDKLKDFRATLNGGDAKIGRKLVYEQGLGQCIICHKVEGKGGIVAPDLSDIASQKHATTEYLLESLIHPSDFVVPGFGNITVSMKDGSSTVGSLVKEDKESLTLKFPDGKTKVIKQDLVKSKTKPISSMPPMGAVLTKHQIRDIIAYLETLKKKADH